MQWHGLVCLSVPLAVAGCITSLQPAEHALRAPDDDAIMSEGQGVRMIAQAGAFPSDAYIEAEVTPLRVKLSNQSEQPLYIRYSAFSLVASDGSVYPAIPPHQVKGTVPTAEALPHDFGFSRFEIAPYYHGFYPGIAPYRGAFDYDGAYYDNHYGYWKTTTRLPTAEMLRRALPEGTLKEGGTLEGYLYFPALKQKRGTEIVLHAELNRPAGEPVSFRLPFVIR